MNDSPGDRQARITVALPPLDDRARRLAAADDWDVGLLDPEDPDERAILIRLAHPDVSQAIDEGRDELDAGGEPFNPRLHLAIHEVVATQIIDNDPPEVYDTAKRLVALGRDRHDVLHMLGTTVAEQLWQATHEQRAYDRAEHMAALAALPDSWDTQFGPPMNRAARRAAARGRRRPHGV